MYKSHYSPRHWYFYPLPSFCLNSWTDGDERVFTLSVAWIFWHASKDFRAPVR